MEPIIFEPIYQERVWGGRKLETLFNRKLPNQNSLYGESWEIVDRPEAQSTVWCGKYKGKTLHELWQNHREEIFGKDFEKYERFPLLFKIIDARENLSVQVHPPEKMADGLGGEPKSEFWYIAQADPGAKIYVGLQEGVTRESFEAALSEGKVVDMLNEIEVHAGDSLFIPAGTVHAIGSGVMIYEIQQNSDTTYRVYDWDRMGLDDQYRELHIKESFRSIDFKVPAPSLNRDNSGMLTECAYFRVVKYEYENGRKVEDRFSGLQMYTVIKGEISWGSLRFRAGDSFLFYCEENQESAFERALVKERVEFLITTIL